MIAERPFERWLAGDASAVVLHTETGAFTRGLIRQRIHALRAAIRDALSDRAGMVVVVGPNDDRTLCASVAGQMAGPLTTVVDPRSAGEVDRILGSNDVAVLLVVGGAGVHPPPGAAVLDVDALVDGVARVLELDGHLERSDPALSEGFAPGTGDCLVLFSSGSTGAPKGIIRSHDSMLRTWSTGELGALEADPCIAVAGPLGYVSSQLIVHQAWRTGVPIALFDGVSSGLLGLVAFMRRTGVTMMSSQVAPYRSMLELPGFSAVGLRWLSLWGEPLLERDVERHRVVQPQCHLMFGYGSTETMVAGCIDIAPDEPIPSRLARFRPFADVLVAVDELRSAEGERSGELLVHNPWLASGYLGDPARTSSTFVTREGKRWARTGDRVTLGADGTFELHGRVDDRLKVLGNNVEPAAVESVLACLPGIAEAAVVGTERPGGGIRLAAFIVRTEGSRLSVSEFRRSARALLSAASVPSTWTVVEALPRVATGKIDRLLLRNQAADLRYEVHPENRPTNEIERVVLGHVCDLLGIDELGIDDDLTDLGLDSLMLAELQVRLEDVLPLAPGRNMKAMAPTVRAMSRADVTRSTLVPMNSEDGSGPSDGQGPGRLIVLVPGAGAGVVAMRPLARRLAGSATIRAVTADDFVSVRRLADATVAALLEDLRASPKSSVVFVGHSWGGLAAVEMARGAVAAGIAVDGVVLLDTRAPAGRFSVQRVRTTVRPRARMAASIAARRHRHGRSRDSEKDRLIAVSALQVRDANRMRWQPVACPGRVVVAEHAHHVDAAQWRRFFPAGLSISTVSAGHSSMVIEPFVADVADAVKVALASWL